MTLAAEPLLTIETASRQGARRLQRVAEQPRLEAQVLLADSLGVTRTWLQAHSEVELAIEAAQAYAGQLARREAGVPLPYVLGWWEFYGRRFRVTPDVLIPRPETEQLVERGLAWLRHRPGEPRVLDVGAGSGCIAVTLAAGEPRCRVVATDRSLAALQVAQSNAVQHGVAARLRLVQADLAVGLADGFDLVCANLPYLPTSELRQWEVSRWEPRSALDGGAGGTEVIRRLLPALPGILSSGGVALLEIGDRQAAEVVSAASQELPGWRVETIPDLAGFPRVIEVERGEQ
jgi:release factor glutamine methyltransferase